MSVQSKVGNAATHSRSLSGKGSEQAPVTFVPFEVRKRQVTKLLISPTGTAAQIERAMVDSTLLLAVARAFYWQQLLDEGKVRNAHDLAKRLRTTSAWVSEILRLTRLSPALLAAIVAGIQPRWISLQRLRGRDVEVPLRWWQQAI